MTKAPRAGAVKTRLQPPLTAEEAAALNACFLRDTAAAISNAGEAAAGVAVYAPADAAGEYATIFPPDFALIPQRGDGFGERLSNAATDLLALGFEACCLIDSDSPTVPAAQFEEAVRILAHGGDDAVVLGPSDDGGYYLIGMRQLHPLLFENIEWSTERVFEQTRSAAARAGLALHLLATGFDVDDRATLRRLCDELLGRDNAAAPFTKKFLRDLIAREGGDRIWPA